MEAGANPKHTMTAAISTAVGPDYSILGHAVEINLWCCPLRSLPELIEQQL